MSVQLPESMPVMGHLENAPVVYAVAGVENGKVRPLDGFLHIGPGPK
jgi:hypothetical protein